PTGTRKQETEPHGYTAGAIVVLAVTRLALRGNKRIEAEPAGIARLGQSCAFACYVVASGAGKRGRAAQSSWGTESGAHSVKTTVDHNIGSPPPVAHTPRVFP